MEVQSNSLAESRVFDQKEGAKLYWNNALNGQTAAFNFSSWYDFFINNIAIFGLYSVERYLKERFKIALN